MKYTVFVKNDSSHYPIRSVDLKSERAAIKKAKDWAKEHPNDLVFIEFYRPSDGQIGYINRDGAAITGKSWTSPESGK